MGGVGSIGGGSRGVLCTELGPHPFWPSPRAPLATWETQLGPLGSSHKAKTLVSRHDQAQWTAKAWLFVARYHAVGQRGQGAVATFPHSLGAATRVRVARWCWSRASPSPRLYIQPPSLSFLLLPVPPQSLSPLPSGNSPRSRSSLPSGNSPRSRARPRGDLATSREEPR
jgi:hypothetical protein